MRTEGLSWTASLWASLTCTRAHCKAHPLLGSVEDDIEALQDSGSNHQATSGGGNAKAIAVQGVVEVLDGLDI